MSAVEDAAKAALHSDHIPPPLMFHRCPPIPLGPNALAMLKILCDRAAELYRPLPDDPFDIGEWMDVLTTEARDALEAICSR